MEKIKEGYYKVAVKEGELEFTELGSFTPKEPKTTDTRVSTTGVIHVKEHCGRMYATMYPYEEGTALCWSGKVLVKIDKIING